MEMTNSFTSCSIHVDVWLTVYTYVHLAVQSHATLQCITMDHMSCSNTAITSLCSYIDAWISFEVICYKTSNKDTNICMYIMLSTWIKITVQHNPLYTLYVQSQEEQEQLAAEFIVWYLIYLYLWYYLCYLLYSCLN